MVSRMRKSFLKVVAVFLAMALGLVAVHWYAGVGTSPLAHSLRTWYLYTAPRIEKNEHMSCLDVDGPAVVASVLVGILTARQRLAVLVWCLFGLSLGIVLLIPIYAQFFRGVPQENWMDLDMGKKSLALFVVYWKALLIGLPFGGGARSTARYCQHLETDFP
jgi:hypothetical protein